jgi:hypothetical protein
MTHYQTVVRVVDGGSGRPLAGLEVSLFDRDRFSADDLLGSGTTDASGEVPFEYHSGHFADLEDRVSGMLPDLYCVVRLRGSEVYSTRTEAVDNTPRRLIEVSLPAEVVARHGLSPAGA